MTPAERAGYGRLFWQQHPGPVRATPRLTGLPRTTPARVGQNVTAPVLWLLGGPGGGGGARGVPPPIGHPKAPPVRGPAHNLVPPPVSWPCPGRVCEGVLSWQLLWSSAPCMAWRLAAGCQSLVCLGALHTHLIPLLDAPQHLCTSAQRLPPFSSWFLQTPPPPPPPNHPATLLPLSLLAHPHRPRCFTQDGKLFGGDAADVLCASGLPRPTLAKIWSLVDRDDDGLQPLPTTTTTTQSFSRPSQTLIPIPQT